MSSACSPGINLPRRSLAEGVRLQATVEPPEVGSTVGVGHQMRRLLHATAICTALALEAPGRVTLVSGKARLFKSGNPLVFSGAVKRVEPGSLRAGDIVDVVDGADKGLLLGYWGSCF